MSQPVEHEVTFGLRPLAYWELAVALRVEPMGVCIISYGMLQDVDGFKRALVTHAGAGHPMLLALPE